MEYKCVDMTRAEASSFSIAQALSMKVIEQCKKADYYNEYGAKISIGQRVI